MIHVIIPVYKGINETKRCIESVLSSDNSEEHRITVIDDCSPDSELTAYLIALSQSGKFQLLRNEQNLGFVATVNRGMELDPEADVILLNSDTEVAGDWLDRLHRCAYSLPYIGTVTPFSNNATICSYPIFCEDNAIPKGWDVPGLDSLFRQANPGKSIEIPTAVGFCMYIKRACLNAVGLFDVEAFGKGYGEENDFCMRARKHGWRHMLCADTFVYHAGGVSFAETQNARKENAMAILQRRHPHYKSLISWHLKKDPARSYRLMVDFLRIGAGRRPIILFITHRRGGGTEKHIRELARHVEKNAEVLVLRPYLWSVASLDWLKSGEQFRLYFHIDRDYQHLLNFLRLTGISQIHFHHLFGHAPKINNIAVDLGLPYDFTIHDYFTICPRISLTSVDNRYCGELGEQQCNTCLNLHPPAASARIKEWRAQNGALLKNAMHVFAPSKDATQRIRAYFNDAKVVFAPHLDIDPKVNLPVAKAPLLPRSGKLRIVVIGAMSQIKGADILEQCATLTQTHNLPLQFHLIGYAYKDIADLPDDVLAIHGEYDDADLQQLIQDIQPHAIWFPAQCPETYSYTLSSALMSGLPVIVPNIGALAERIRQRPWSWTCPWNWPADEWNKFFVQIRNDHFITGIGPMFLTDTPSCSHYQYHDYVQSRERTVLTEGALSEVRDLLTKHGRTRFNFLERVTLDSRRVLNPLLRLARHIFPNIKKFRRIFSPHNRKMLKAWLTGRWP